ncbi:M14 family metallopeptidase [Pontimicrobium aquaticum]|uniref:Peptidase M14 n=1 Tax=Pontimicrobium aquaticum TaxID=2565367 RepID=A0A4U0EWT1_9FLAO|nr:M14 metallopeptidase family protein [Pontimicrobium aquaticum]TJY35804.1 peptidase M14 [Pontimicrobium aquaticum]
MKNLFRLLFCLFFLANLSLNAQIPKPSDVFGFEVGADYKLADYDQMLEYYEKLAASTDRVQMIDIGKSVMGRPIKLLFISSEENIKSLEKWRTISEKLSRARISPEEAKKLSYEGKAIVWFDGGMHATERAHAQMTSELMWRIASEESDEMKKIRDNVVTLVVPVINPDGVDIVVDWYKKNLGTPYETTGPPILYQKYVGHDNNRDWFMNNMPETKAATTVLYNQWYPQIVHNHHQTSPAWARIFLPPFRSPVNPNIHPGVTTGVNLVGTAMANRFAMKKMPGVISGTSFSMFWNGGMRTTPYYHNQIGILTEVAHATPTPRFYDPKKKPKNVGGKPSNGTEIFYPYPWEGGESHFRDAVDYMLTASMAVLDLAADKKDEFLYNIYDMGKDAIENTDEAFAYIIPKDQWNPSEAINLTNILMQGGLEAHKATSGFSVGEKNYEAGSIILYGAQAFRPYLTDLMEKQNYPDQFLYPGGPPQPPYDLAGWTLPMQMGVTVDRVNESFNTNTTPITSKLSYDEGSVNGSGSFMFSNKDNLSALAINRLQKAGYKVSQLKTDYNNYSAGSFLVSGKKSLKNDLTKLSKELGLDFEGVTNVDKSKFKELNKVKVGLYKSWQANMDEGWTRWVLEQFEFDIDTLHNKDIKNGKLSQYSAIIFPSQSSNGILHGYRENSMPKKFTGGIGLDGMAKIDQYAKSGGAVIFFDSASDLAIEQLGLPVRNVISNLSSSNFFIPGSLIRMKVDTKNPLAYGMMDEVAASFNRSRAFQKVTQRKSGEGGVENIADAPEANVIEVAKYADKDLLMSGWAMGEDRYLKNKSAMMHIPHGTGDIVLFGFRPQFRGQPRGTYKLIFNSIYMGAEK